MAKLPDLVASEIEDLTIYFEKTQNPMAAWKVYSLAKKTGRPIPDTVMAEVDRFADGIAAVADRAMSLNMNARPLYFTPEKLGALWRGTGVQNPADALRRRWRDMNIGYEVNRLVEGGMGVTDAIAAVAKLPPRLSDETVKKAWQAYQRT